MTFQGLSGARPRRWYRMTQRRIDFSGPKWSAMVRFNVFRYFPLFPLGNVSPRCFTVSTRFDSYRYVSLHHRPRCPVNFGTAHALVIRSPKRRSDFTGATISTGCGRDWTIRAHRQDPSHSRGPHPRDSRQCSAKIKAACDSIEASECPRINEKLFHDKIHHGDNLQCKIRPCDGCFLLFQRGFGREWPKVVPPAPPICVHTPPVPPPVHLETQQIMLYCSLYWFSAVLQILHGSISRKCSVLHNGHILNNMINMSARLLSTSCKTLFRAS